MDYITINKYSLVPLYQQFERINKRGNSKWYPKPGDNFQQNMKYVQSF